LFCQSSALGKFPDHPFNVVFHGSLLMSAAPGGTAHPAGCHHDQKSLRAKPDYHVLIRRVTGKRAGRS
jgi:hypothetical protein